MSTPTGTIDKIVMYDEYGEPVHYGITVDPNNIMYDEDESIIDKIQNIDGDISDLNDSISTIESNIEPLKLGFAIGESNDIASTSNRTASISNFVRKDNGIIAIKFSTSVVSGSTLNINNTGLCNIKYKGAIIGDGVINAGDTVTFMFDGNNYVILGIDDVAIAPTLKHFNKFASLDSTHRTVNLDMTNYTYDANDIIFVYINGLYGKEFSEWTLQTGSTPPSIFIPASQISDELTDVTIEVLKLV